MLYPTLVDVIIDNFAIAEHHLRRALEAVLDIGRHIVAKKGLGRPEDYRGIFELLGHGRWDLSKNILHIHFYILKCAGSDFPVAVRFRGAVLSILL